MAITVSANGGGDYTPAPAGVHQAVCCDVVDLGLVETEWQGSRSTKHKVRLVWQIDALMDDGRPYTVSSRYTASLHEKSRLRADLQSWRGRPFTAEELAAFDLEKLLGAGCLLNIVHTARNGRSYADIVAIMPLPKQTPKLAVSADYIRQQDRQPEASGGSRAADSYAPAQSVAHQLAAQVDEVSVDDIPF
jgi:hypothetical protein